METNLLSEKHHISLGRLSQTHERIHILKLIPNKLIEQFPNSAVYVCIFRSSKVVIKLIRDHPSTNDDHKRPLKTANSKPRVASLS